MVYYKNYVAGWLNSSIHDFIQDFPRASESTKYALITCLDSHMNPGSLLAASPELKHLQAKARPLGSGLLMPTKLLLEADSQQRLFFGFDEVWFFPTEQIEARPDSVSLVGPKRIDPTSIEKLGRWMSDHSCSLGLGDGDGLNFIVKAQGLVRYLLGHTTDQPLTHATLADSPVGDSGQRPLAF